MSPIEPIVTAPKPTSPPAERVPALQIVEASRPVAEALARVCRGRGVEVEIFATAGRALAAVCDRKPVAILSAMHLPGLPGSALVAALASARDYRAIPVALITADPDVAGSAAAPYAVIAKTRTLREDLAAFLDSIGLPVRTESAGGPRASGTPLAGRRILVAEDAAVLQKLVQHVLHVAGADVVVVGNGAEAVEAVQAACFDLVLMDVEMPVLDGCRATQQLRGFGQKLPIVALTGHASQEFRTEAIECGFDEVLAKPVPKRVLLEVCDRLLRAGSDEPRSVRPL